MDWINSPEGVHGFKQMLEHKTNGAWLHRHEGVGSIIMIPHHHFVVICGERAEYQIINTQDVSNYKCPNAQVVSN